MNAEHPYQHYREKVRPALDSKLDEFALLGYGEVKEDELWLYLTRKKWKKPKEDIRLFEVVEDILSLTVSEFMNFTTIEAFKQPSIFSAEGKKELKDLLF
ncbi:post-transcriptional regulator [Peribacillus sp. SCS-26]|uniref:post-transcriptional regulator n=1 Tax=Paraperibacillus marinus TaxID=3115295 RepID=UPI0039057F41